MNATLAEWIARAAADAADNAIGFTVVIYGDDGAVSGMCGLFPEPAAALQHAEHLAAEINEPGEPDVLIRVFPVGPA